MGQSQILPYLIGLSGSGYHYRVISFEKSDAFEKQKKIINDLIKEYPIEWIPLNYHKKPPVISTIRDIRKLKKTVEQEIFKKKPLIIHCRSYLTSLVAIKLCKKYNIKYLFDMRGFYADERVEGNIWSLKNPIYKWIYNYFKKKERLFFQLSDHTVSLTSAGKNEILSWNIDKLSEKDITVIPCCSDFELFNISEYDLRIRIRLELNIKSDTLVLAYLGSLGSWYLVREMLLFFEKLKEKYPKARFLILSHQDITDYQDEIDKLRLSNDDFLCISAKRNEVPLYLSAVDIGISFIKPSFSKKASSPTKVGEMLAMGIPMIVNKDVGDMNYFFQDHPFGVILDVYDEGSYDLVVEHIPKLLELSKEEIREQAKQLLDLKTKGVETYLKIYKKLESYENNLL